eukprot:Clim_evm98s11 gene=Clim_evmTU98s11
MESPVAFLQEIGVENCLETQSDDDVDLYPVEISSGESLDEEDVYEMLATVSSNVDLPMEEPPSLVVDPILQMLKINSRISKGPMRKEYILGDGPGVCDHVKSDMQVIVRCLEQCKNVAIWKEIGLFLKRKDQSSPVNCRKANKRIYFIPAAKCSFCPNPPAVPGSVEKGKLPAVLRRMGVRLSSISAVWRALNITENEMQHVREQNGQKMKLKRVYLSGKSFRLEDISGQYAALARKETPESRIHFEVRPGLSPFLEPGIRRPRVETKPQMKQMQGIKYRSSFCEVCNLHFDGYLEHIYSRKHTEGLVRQYKKVDNITLHA